MIATVLVVVLTHNLALGVGVGVLLSALFFARKVAQVIRVRSDLDESATCRTYVVRDSSSSRRLADSCGPSISRKRPENPHRHHPRALLGSHGGGALDKVVLKFRREGKEVEVLGLNEASATLVDRLGNSRQAGCH
jgi:SulP family sulfate permease